MANLVVRNIDEEIIKALKERAGASGHSAEAEHRLILASALLRPKKKSFSELLMDMPNVGRDSDFERSQEVSDTNVISEIRKGKRANSGVQKFFDNVISNNTLKTYRNNVDFPTWVVASLD